MQRHTRYLVCLFLVLFGFVLGFGFLGLAACDTVRDRAASGASALIDCEAPHLQAGVAELVPLAKQAVLALIRDDGTVDTTKLRAIAAGLVGDLSRCALVSAIAVLSSPPSSGATMIAVAPLVPDPGALRAAFEPVRVGWGGATFRTRVGLL